MARVSGGQRITLAKYTTTERNALTASAGMCIYNTTTNEIEVYNGSGWTGGEDFVAGDATVQSNVDSLTTQIGPIKVQVFDYNIAAGADGSVGTHTIGTLPQHSVITKLNVVTTTAFATASGTANLRIADAGRIHIAEAAHNAGPWNTDYATAGHKGASSTEVPAYVTSHPSGRTLDLRITTQAVTAGRFWLYVEYFTATAF